MKISEVVEVLEGLKRNADSNVEILGISVNDTKITVCYEDTDFNTKKYKADYKNLDVY